MAQDLVSSLSLANRSPLRDPGLITAFGTGRLRAACLFLA